MNAIKVGDKVRIVDLGVYHPHEQQGLLINNTGVVTAILRHGALKVRTDNASEPTDTGGRGWTFTAEELALVEDQG